VKPAWFTAALLGILALVLVSHLGLITFAAYRCSNYGYRLGARLDRTVPGSPEAKQVATAIYQNQVRCHGLADNVDAISKDDQGLVLALLGGAGLSAGVAAGPGQRRPPGDPGP
jgi:hypothetical protein